jgi:hypothetical protein
MGELARSQKKYTYPRRSPIMLTLSLVEFRVAMQNSMGARDQKPVRWKISLRSSQMQMLTQSLKLISRRELATNHRPRICAMMIGIGT